MAATPSQSANADPATWRFHDRLRFITHDAHQCDVCDAWLTHFAHAMARRNATLAEAETQRDAAILGQLPAECAKLRKDLDAAGAELSALKLRHELRIDDLRDLLSRLADPTPAVPAPTLRGHQANFKTDNGLL